MTKLPLLEAFLVESIRTHCFLSTVIHRVPLKPYTFHDGYTVPKGEIVEFYQYRAMKDESLYPNPDKFDPSRYKGTGKSATDMGFEWPFWGNSKLAWYVGYSQVEDDDRTDICLSAAPGDFMSPT